MNKDKFLELLTEELELGEPLTLDTNLKEIDEWDSMTAMLLIGLVSNEFDVELSAEDIQDITDINSLIKKIGEDKLS